VDTGEDHGEEDCTKKSRRKAPAFRRRKKSSRRSARRYGDILYEVKDQVAWVTINRPARHERVPRARRSTSSSTRSNRRANDPSIACAVVTGRRRQGPSRRAADFYAMKRLTWVNAAMWNDRMQGLAMTIRGLAIPVIAMVSGWWHGRRATSSPCGAISSSRRTMRCSARPAPRVGACPTVGGDAISAAHHRRAPGARNDLLRAPASAGPEAAQIGLINKCVPQKDLLREDIGRGARPSRVTARRPCG